MFAWLIQGKYEKELKDTRARELFYAEREAILDKVLKFSPFSMLFFMYMININGDLI